MLFGELSDMFRALKAWDKEAKAQAKVTARDSRKPRKAGAKPKKFRKMSKKVYKVYIRALQEIANWELKARLTALMADKGILARPMLNYRKMLIPGKVRAKAITRNLLQHYPDHKETILGLRGIRAEGLPEDLIVQRLLNYIPEPLPETNSWELPEVNPKWVLIYYPDALKLIDGILDKVYAWDDWKHLNDLQISIPGRRMQDMVEGAFRTPEPPLAYHWAWLAWNRFYFTDNSFISTTGNFLCTEIEPTPEVLYKRYEETMRLKAEKERKVRLVDSMNAYTRGRQQKILAIWMGIPTKTLPRQMAFYDWYGLPKKGKIQLDPIPTQPRKYTWKQAAVANMERALTRYKFKIYSIWMAFPQGTESVQSPPLYTVNDAVKANPEARTFTGGYIYLRGVIPNAKRKQQVVVTGPSGEQIMKNKIVRGPMNSYGIRIDESSPFGNLQSLYAQLSWNTEKKPKEMTILDLNIKYGMYAPPSVTTARNTNQATEMDNNLDLAAMSTKKAMGGSFPFRFTHMHPPGSRLVIWAMNKCFPEEYLSPEDLKSRDNFQLHEHMKLAVLLARSQERGHFVERAGTFMQTAVANPTYKPPSEADKPWNFVDDFNARYVPTEHTEAAIAAIVKSRFGPAQPAVPAVYCPGSKLLYDEHGFYYCSKCGLIVESTVFDTDDTSGSGELPEYERIYGLFTQREDHDGDSVGGRAADPFLYQVSHGKKQEEAINKQIAGWKGVKYQKEYPEKDEYTPKTLRIRQRESVEIQVLGQIDLGVDTSAEIAKVLAVNRFKIDRAVGRLLKSGKIRRQMDGSKMHLIRARPPAKKPTRRQ